MRKWYFFLAIIILGFLQLIWPVVLNFFNCKPDFLLILIVVFVFYLDFKTALLFAVLAGLAKDVFLPGPLAINTILFSIWSCLIYLLSRQISTDYAYVGVVIVLITAFLNNLVGGLQVVSSGGIIPWGIFLRNLVISSVYTAAFAPLVFKFIKRRIL